MDIFCIGINFRTAGVEELERLSFQDHEIEKALYAFDRSGFLKEAVLVSTCNRVEVYGVTTQINRVTSFIENFFHQRGGIPYSQLGKLVYKYFGIDAVKHLFKVTSSLDSMVVGEPQILGQLKKAYRTAKRLNCSEKILNTIFEKAFKCAKRVRTETQLSMRPVSIASIAAGIVKNSFSDLSKKSALIIGAGEMAEQILIELSNYNLNNIFIYNRTKSKAENLAKKYSAISVNEIDHNIEKIDILVSSTASDKYILNKDQIIDAMSVRKGRSLFLIDISVPRGIDPAVQDIENIHLYNLDDLGKIAEENKQLRQKEVQHALKLLNNEAASFNAWYDRQKLEPIISALNNKITTICENEIYRTIRNFETMHWNNKSARVFARALAKKILHDPIKVMKQNAMIEENHYAKAVRKLFCLDQRIEKSR